MATRQKTISFAWDLRTTLVTDATLTSLGSITLYTPENSVGNPINFISAFVEIGFNDVITATGGTITEHRVALNLGGTDTTITETDDIANSGENIGGVLTPFDFTSKFNSEYGTGTSKTCEVKVYFDQDTGTTLGMINVSAVIYLTYEYDDGASTHIKTVYIPLESRNSALATTETEIGTNQIPALDTFLPETSKTIRDYFFIIEGNQNNGSAAVDITLNLKIDSDATFNPGIFERALASDIFVRVIWRHSTPPSTSSVHAFKAWASSAVFNNLVITLVVTYEFDPSSATILNSIIIPIELGSPLGLNTTGSSRFKRDFFIQEPDTVTLRQSAIRFNYNTTAAVSGLNIRTGGQSYRAYTDNGAVVCGMFSLQHRVDSGSSQGAGLTLARGLNTLVFDAYRTDTTGDPNNLNGYLLLNYTSGLASGGVGVHAKTLFKVLAQWDALLSDRFIVTGKSFAIPESNYWIVSAGIISCIWDNLSANAFTMDVQVLAGEGKGAGFLDVYADAVQSDAERRCSIVWMRGRDVFKRFPTDPDSERINIETSRDWRFFTAGSTSQGLIMFLTYHSIFYTISGEVSGYSGDGSGIPVKLYRSDNKELIGETTTAAGGGFSFTWYDDTIPVYAEAREDDTHTGRSANGLPGS